jgi:hypothetical protein
MAAPHKRRSSGGSGDMSSSDGEFPLPIITDLHGRSVDPTSGRILRGGQGNPDSIFYVPSRPLGDNGDDYYHTVPDLVQKLRRAGFRGKRIRLVAETPRPEDENPPVLPPPPKSTASETLYEVSEGNIHRTSCGYCWAVTQNKQRPRGFTLEEFSVAATNGCATCVVLQKSVGHFAELIFKKFSPSQVRVRQNEASSTFKTGLLSQTDKVTVFFDEYGAEAIELDFKRSG